MSGMTGISSSASWPEKRGGVPGGILLIGIDLSMWMIVSLIENSMSIFIMHLIFIMSCSLILLLFSKTSFEIFFTSILLRSAFTILAWYSAFNNERKYFLGTNSDSYRFWEGITLSYEEVSSSYEDPLFPSLNIFISNIASNIDNASYLAATQSVLFGGALMVVFSSILISDLYGKRIGHFTGLLLAFSPISIAFSTGLMRDSLIGMFGFLFLLTLNRFIISNKYAAKAIMFTLFIASGFALAYLRSISLAAFICAAFLMIFSGTEVQPNPTSKITKIWTLTFLFGILAYSVYDRFDRYENIFLYADTSRNGQGLSIGMDMNPDGITTKIAKISPLLFIPISPTALMQPIPFYLWDAPEWEGGPPAVIDILIGFGGLFNQILFGFYIIAVSYWVREEDTFGFRVCFLFTLLVGTMTFIGLGHFRMMMSHTYPFFYAGISLAILKLLNANLTRIIKLQTIWASSLGAIYACYLSYIDSGQIFISAFFFCLFFCGFHYLWKSGRYIRKSYHQDRIATPRA